MIKETTPPTYLPHDFEKTKIPGVTMTYSTMQNKMQLNTRQAQSGIVPTIDARTGGSVRQSL